MAAYASLVSLMYIIEKIQDHPHPPISLDQNQVESLTENVTFLQDFLEVYNYRVRDYGLESHIVDVASAAEDVLESNIVDRILDDQSNSSTELFYQDLQRVIQDMDLIKIEVMEIKEKMGPVQRSSVPVLDVGSSRFSPSMTQNTMVGFDVVLDEILDRLTRQSSSDCQIIPITGMGGMGKTTLARHVYEHSIIRKHYDNRAWVTISQEYNICEIIIQLLLCFRSQDSAETLRGKSEGELGKLLYQSLWGRRYLIILDDMWSIEAWNRLKFFFPNENEGSGIIVTSRLSELIVDLTHGYAIRMNFLNEETSWSLLRKIVFGLDDNCPLELEAIGKEIAKNCKGLPLSLVVIGGLLSKSNRSQEYWKYIAENVNTIVSLENDAQCLNLLYLSYNHLPVHLKLCFLYFGVFEEDENIAASDLFTSWVAEGFLKPIDGKSLEEAAEQYLSELVSRNLILRRVLEYSDFEEYSYGIHDLLRELCIREAEKEKFFVTVKHSKNPRVLTNQRRIALQKEFLDAFQYPSNLRSLIVSSNDFMELRSKVQSRMVRVLRGYFDEESVDHLVNLRSFGLHWTKSHLSSSIYLFWNLHTLNLILNRKITFVDIFRMPHLRTLNGYKIVLGNSTSGKMHGKDNFILKYLHNLEWIFNFRCTKKMVRRIPNIKTLGIVYESRKVFTASQYCFNNFVRLQKLEKLRCTFRMNRRPFKDDLITFPHSLKELTLGGGRLTSEEISTKIGSLPSLQRLSLQADALVSPEWETVEGQFCNLKYLKLYHCDSLESWKTEDTHFPCLEKLVLSGLQRLKEIPLSIGDIPTLQLIEIRYCKESSLYYSGKEIAEEQDELGNEDLQVVVEVRKDREVGLELGHNFIEIKSGGKKTLEELREERLKRERTEKERGRALLMMKSKKHGGFISRRYVSFLFFSHLSDDGEL